MTFPDVNSYGQIIGRYLLGVGDGADVDLLPDSVPASGTVTFTPNAPRLLVLGSTPQTTIAPQPIICTFDPATGDLLGPNGLPGVWLIATDCPDIAPVDWTYKVKIAVSGEIPLTFDIAVPGNTTTDITTLTPVPTSTGTYPDRVVLRAPDDSLWQLTVSASGVLGTTPA